jgi:hypothetical protein
MSPKMTVIAVGLYTTSYTLTLLYEHAKTFLGRIPSAAMSQDQVLAGTKHGFERPKMQIEYCCLSVTI